MSQPYYSARDPEAVEVAYLPYQELETSDGFPYRIDPVDPVDYARTHDRDSVYSFSDNGSVPYL